MNKAVVVTGDAQGNVITISSNPEFGYIRVEQLRIIFGEDGFARPRKVTALIHGQTSFLKSLGLKKGEELPNGRIVIQESLLPFSKDEEQQKREIKIAGKTGIVCSFQGAPIYRRHIYDDSNRFREELVQHDNVDQIREAFKALEAQGVKNPHESETSLTNP